MWKAWATWEKQQPFEAQDKQAAALRIFGQLDLGGEKWEHLVLTAKIPLHEQHSPKSG
jgi:hypothetical protein